MNRFLKITALLELPTGLGLIAMPALVVRLLLGEEISGVGFPLARVAGVALLALGVIDWGASLDADSRAAGAVANGMVIYNLGVAAVLGAAAWQGPPTGLLLWPAVVIHSAMATWRIVSLLRGRA